MEVQLSQWSWKPSQDTPNSCWVWLYPPGIGGNGWCLAKLRLSGTLGNSSPLLATVNHHVFTICTSISSANSGAMIGVDSRCQVYAFVLLEGGEATCAVRGDGSTWLHQLDPRPSKGFLFSSQAKPHMCSITCTTYLYPIHLSIDFSILSRLILPSF